MVFYTYDCTGNILTADYAGEQTETNTYNELGLLTTVTTAEGDTLYQYDDASRLISVTQPNGETVSYTYDSHGNRATMTYPNGKTVKYNQLRFLYGVRFSQPDTLRSACLDYAFTAALNAEREKDSRVLAGERYLLYRCFERSFNGKMTIQEQWCFYLYLLLKVQLRSELVQVNKQTGFQNFYNYDDRKKLLWRNYPEFYNEDFRQSINAPFHEQKLSSLEGRLSPKDTIRENLLLIHRIDRAKLFFDADSIHRRSTIRLWRPYLNMENRAKGENFFYVFSSRKWKITHLRAALQRDTWDDTIITAIWFDDNPSFWPED